jgi:hypothetical protein
VFMDYDMKSSFRSTDCISLAIPCYDCSQILLCTTNSPFEFLYRCDRLFNLSSSRLSFK